MNISVDVKVKLETMKQEDRELLFIDLCGRVPYKVRMFEIEPINNIQSNLTLQSISNKASVICITPSGGAIGSSIDAFKPYLFPLSSMTEEQKIECFKGTDIELDEHNEIWSTFPISNSDIVLTNLNNWLKVINWLNKNHFDYRGLIEKGLAIDATNLNVY